MKPYILESLRQRYPVGTRVELVSMDDVQAPPIGTKGTVRGVDDIGSILVQWDNGCTLNVVYGEDECKVIEPTRICPFCKEAYTDYPALSRTDNKTEICPTCGVREALLHFGVKKNKVEEFITTYIKK